MKSRETKKRGSLRSLSEKEKFQLLELQKTRLDIMKELGKLPANGKKLPQGSLDINKSATLMRTTSSTGNDLGLSGSKYNYGNRGSQKMSKTADYIDKLRKSIDMIPIMASSGESAMNAGLNRGKIKLPVFQLPPINLRSVSSRQTAKHSTEQLSRREFSPCGSLATVRETVRKLCAGLNPRERNFILSYLSLQEREFQYFEAQMSNDLRHTKSSTLLSVAGFKEKNIIDFATNDETVFSMARSNKSISFDRRIYRYGDIGRRDSLGALHVAGLTQDFSTYLKSHSMILQNSGKSSSTSQRKNNSKIGRVSNTNQKKQETDFLRSSSLKFVQRQHCSEDQSIDLASELFRSLQNMERHSSMVKKNIAFAQEMMSIANPKAKALLYTVAAEKMKQTLFTLLKVDMKRGMLAWKTATHQLRLQVKASKLIKLLGIRNILVGLDNIICRKLTINILRWKEFTITRTMEIQKENFVIAAIKIQSAIRGCIGRRKCFGQLQRRKYQKLYDATIKLQACFRSKLYRWKYLSELLDIRRQKAATLAQRIYFGFKARKRVKLIKLRQSKDLAATLLQKVMRGKIARKLIVRIERERIQKIFATKIQALVRGFVTRKTIDTVLENKKKYGHAMKIQAIVRGFITRLNISKKLAELKEHRHYRNKSATTIGAAYRGYRCRLIYKMMLLKMNKVRSEENRAVTIINTMVRGFLGRLHLRQLYQERREMWIRDARLWQEMWSDDSASWFYFNAGTGVALWEPSKSGYTKSDGMLVLTSGEIIEDPLVNLEENSEVDAVREQKKQNRLCSECAQRVAIRNCSECGDKFCTKCYKATHATGARRKHNFTATGPLDCTECELVLAERWCVSCDEAYCDSCWRKVHSRGKRRFHPFSEVSDEGRIDSRIYTIDGEELNNYDATYSQQRLEQQATEEQLSAPEAEYATEVIAAEFSEQGQEVDEWTSYFDDQGYEYFYNNYTGVSQYENPYQ